MHHEATSESQLSYIVETLMSLKSAVDEIRERIKGNTKDFLTVEEVAEVTGRAPYTVRNWIREGKIRAIRIDGSGPRGRLLIPREELKKLVSEAKGSRIPPIATSR